MIHDPNQMIEAQKVYEVSFAEIDKEFSLFVNNDKNLIVSEEVRDFKDFQKAITAGDLYIVKGCEYNSKPDVWEFITRECMSTDEYETYKLIKKHS